MLDALVGRPIVGNAFRGTLVEALLAPALAPEWEWLADGWGAFDFRGPGGVGLEVKQSAARQDWHGEGARPSPGRFDIAARTGLWDADGRWLARPGRNAAIYVFAWHPRCDAAADHRDPAQWQFHVVPAARLPAQRTLGLAGVRKLAEPCGIDAVKGTVTGCLAGLGV